MLLAGCSGPPSGSPTTLVVYAAASLTDVFDELADEFEAAIRARTSWSTTAGAERSPPSSAGAPADVFAAAE